MRGGWDRGGVIDSFQGVAGGIVGRFYLLVFFFNFCLWFCLLVSHVQSFL